MIRYYAWAAAEQALSHVPGGKDFYRRIGRRVKRRTQGTGSQFVTSFPVARQAKALTPPGGVILDVGTGWFHHDAFLLFLAGDYRILLFDIEDRAELGYIRNYLRNLHDHADLIARELDLDAEAAREKLRELLSLPDRSSIYKRCGFEPCITDKVTEPFLPENSVDFMVSNCVLVHVRPEHLLGELVALRRMLKDSGAMCHMLGHDDHWAFHDPTMSWPSFNYLRYSERMYRMLFDTRLEYHNRMVKPEFISVFAAAGLEVSRFESVITDESRASVRGLPHLDPRYASYDLDDLAIVYSYVTLTKPAHSRVQPLGDHSPRVE